MFLSFSFVVLVRYWIRVKRNTLLYRVGQYFNYSSTRSVDGKGDQTDLVHLLFVTVIVNE